MVQITAPLIGTSLYLLFIYLLYDRMQGFLGGISLKALTHKHTHTQTCVPGIAGEPGASLTSLLSDSYD